MSAIVNLKRKRHSESSLDTLTSFGSEVEKYDADEQYSSWPMKRRQAYIDDQADDELDPRTLELIDILVQLDEFKQDVSATISLISEKVENLLPSDVVEFLPEHGLGTRTYADVSIDTIDLEPLEGSLSTTTDSAAESELEEEAKRDHPEALPSPILPSFSISPPQTPAPTPEDVLTTDDKSHYWDLRQCGFGPGYARWLRESTPVFTYTSSRYDSPPPSPLLATPSEPKSHGTVNIQGSSDGEGNNIDNINACVSEGSVWLGEELGLIPGKDGWNGFTDESMERPMQNWRMDWEERKLEREVSLEAACIDADDDNNEQSGEEQSFADSGLLPFSNEMSFDCVLKECDLRHGRSCHVASPAAPNELCVPEPQALTPHLQGLPQENDECPAEQPAIVFDIEATLKRFTEERATMAVARQALEESLETRRVEMHAAFEARRKADEEAITEAWLNLRQSLEVSKSKGEPRYVEWEVLGLLTPQKYRVEAAEAEREVRTRTKEANERGQAADLEAQAAAGARRRLAEAEAWRKWVDAEAKRRRAEAMPLIETVLENAGLASYQEDVMESRVSMENVNEEEMDTEMSDTESPGVHRDLEDVDVHRDPSSAAILPSHLPPVDNSETLESSIQPEVEAASFPSVVPGHVMGDQNAISLTDKVSVAEGHSLCYAGIMVDLATDTSHNTQAAERVEEEELVNPTQRASELAYENPSVVLEYAIEGEMTFEVQEDISMDDLSATNIFLEDTLTTRKGDITTEDPFATEQKVGTTKEVFIEEHVDENTVEETADEDSSLSQIQCLNQDSPCPASKTNDHSVTSTLGKLARAARSIRKMGDMPSPAPSPSASPVSEEKKRRGVLALPGFVATSPELLARRHQLNSTETKAQSAESKSTFQLPKLKGTGRLLDGAWKPVNTTPASPTKRKNLWGDTIRFLRPKQEPKEPRNITDSPTTNTTNIALLMPKALDARFYSKNR